MIFQVDWLGWDIIEPITYSVQQGSLLLAIRYYLKYHQDRRPANIVNAYTLKSILSKKQTRLDYQFLLSQIATQERSIERLRAECLLIRNRVTRSEFIG